MLPVSLRPTVSISLHVHFRSQGFKWPLRDDDRVEVWADRSHELLFIITGELLKTLLRHHLDSMAVQTMLRVEMEHLEPPKRGDEPMPGENPIDRDRKQTLRDQRKHRKPPRKMILIGLAFAGAEHVFDVVDLILGISWH